MNVDISWILAILISPILATNAQENILHYLEKVKKDLGKISTRGEGRNGVTTTCTCSCEEQSVWTQSVWLRGIRIFL